MVSWCLTKRRLSQGNLIYFIGASSMGGSICSVLQVLESVNKWARIAPLFHSRFFILHTDIWTCVSHIYTRAILFKYFEVETVNSIKSYVDVTSQG